jgi:hypothetical protein
LSRIELLATDLESRFRKRFVFLKVPLASKRLSLNFFRRQTHARWVSVFDACNQLAQHSSRIIASQSRNSRR